MNLKAMLKRKNMTVLQLARKAEISTTHAYDVVCGRKNPSMVVGQKIADALGVSLATLAREGENGDKER